MRSELNSKEPNFTFRSYAMQPKGEERYSVFFEMHNSMLDESIDLHHYYKCSMAAQTTEMIC